MVTTALLNWLNSIGLEEFNKKAANLSLPRIGRGPFGLSLIANKKYKTGEIIFVIPNSIYEPFSARIAEAQALHNAPALLQKVQEIEKQITIANKKLVSNNYLNLKKKLMSSGYNNETPTFQVGLIKPTLLAINLLMTATQNNTPESVYPRLLLHESSSGGFLHPILASDEDLSFFLQESPALHSVRKQKRFWGEIHRGILGDSYDKEDGGFFNKTSFLWAISIVLSRAISHPTMPFTMIPFFDFMNHSFSLQSARFHFEKSGSTEKHGGGFFVVSATRDHNIGQEIFISYTNNKCNHKLFATYGMCCDDNPTPSMLPIAVETLQSTISPSSSSSPLTLSSSSLTMKKAHLLKVLNPSLNAQSGGNFFFRVTVHSRGEKNKEGEEVEEGKIVDEDKIRTAYSIMCSQGKEDEAVIDRLVANRNNALKSNNLHSLFSSATRIRANEALTSAVSETLKKYGSTREEDLAYLSSPPPSWGGFQQQAWRSSALRLRINEKYALETLLRRLQRTIC